MTNDQHDDDESTIKLPLSEETLDARIVEREQGKVRIHKRVETDQVHEDIELHRDNVVVERLARDEIVAERRDPWREGDALMIPVYEEVVVTEKQLRLREVIRVSRARQSEQVAVEGEVRREVVDVERTDG